MTRADYEAAINKLIPQASKHATLHTPGCETVEEYNQAWNELYFARMDELAREAGLRR